MKIEEVIAALRGTERRARMVGSSGEWMNLGSLMKSNTGWILDGDFELEPLAPVFEHWEKLPGWANKFVAANSYGEGWMSYDLDPFLIDGANGWSFNGIPYGVSIPKEFWPQWQGDWRESKIANPSQPGVWVTREKFEKAWDRACVEQSTNHPSRLVVKGKLGL